jgi:6-phosphogluconolactonase
MNRDVVFCETAQDVADAAADLIAESQTEAIAERGVFRIALSGGSTPKLLYQLLASADFCHEMEWSKWEVFWSDERCVPPNSPDSNFNAAKTALLDHVAVGEIFRIHGEAPDPTQVAEEYARTLRARFEPGTPVFDVILLGMGADGHTASLFPGHPALKSDKLIEAVEVVQQIRQRITFTFNLINNARRIIFMITGSEKADRIREIRDGNSVYPAAQVDPITGENIWLLDHTASALIR